MTRIVLQDGSLVAERLVYPQQGGVVTFYQGGEGRHEICTRIDPYEDYFTDMTEGKQTSFLHAIISKDGKTMSYIIKGSGAPFEGEGVFDKQ